MSRKDKIKIALIQKGWTQRRLAKEMGVSPAYLQDIIRENRNPQERLLQIDRLLGTHFALKCEEIHS